MVIVVETPAISVKMALIKMLRALRAAAILVRIFGTAINGGALELQLDDLHRVSCIGKSD